MFATSDADVHGLMNQQLRATIWILCCNFPRTIELRYGYPIGRPRSPSPPPVMLHVSQESRAFALKNYGLALHICPHPFQIYFNFAVDTVVLALGEQALFLGYDGEVEYFVEQLNQSDLNRVQFLGIDETLFNMLQEMWHDEIDELSSRGLGSRLASPFEVLPHFPKPEIFHIVHVEGEEEHEWGARACFCDEHCEFFFQGWPTVNMTFVKVSSARSIEGLSKGLEVPADVEGYQAVQ